MPKAQSTVLFDWKKWGSYIGTEYRLQLGRYARCPYLFNKITQQMTHKPEVDAGIICWIGSEGVQAKLILNREELQEAGEMHVLASKLAMFAAKIETENGWKTHTPSRYEHPLKPGTFLWSVTEVNKYALAKEGLLGWYHKKGVEGMLELIKQHHFDAWQPEDMTVEAALKSLEERRLRPTDLRDKAGEQGRIFHKLAMLFLQGKRVDMTQAPPWQVNFLSKFAEWGQRVHLEPLAVEQTVYEEAEPIAGTLDCLGRVDTGWVESERERVAHKEAA